MTASTSIPAVPGPLATVRSPLPPPARLSGIPLRPYQQEALAAIERAAARGLRRLLVALPTGAGKTVVVGHLIHRRGGRAVVLAHRDELLEQARDKLCAIEPAAADQVAILRGGGPNDALRAPILVASVPTLARPERLAALPAGIGTVIVDEAHHVIAPTYMRILRALGAFDPDPQRAPLVVGITATPERGDREGLGQVFQRLVYHKAIADLITARYLAGVRAVQISIEADFGDLPLNLAGDFAEGDLERVLLDAQAPTHAVAAFLEHGADRRRALLFAPTVRVAHAMAEAFRAAGVPAEALDGGTPERERAAMLGRLRAGTTRLLSNVNVLTEGYDEPAIDTIIVARPTRSRVLYLQAVGRGLRPHPGKRDCLIIDLVGASTRHDLVTAPEALGLAAGVHGGLTGTLQQPQEQRVARDEEALSSERLVSQAVDPFQGQPIHWVRVDGEDGRASFVLSLPDGWLRLEPADGRSTDPSDPASRWDVLRQRRRAAPELVAAGLAIGYAQGIAEDLLRQAGVASVLFDPRGALASPAGD